MLKKSFLDMGKKTKFINVIYVLLFSILSIERIDCIELPIDDHHFFVCKKKFKWPLAASLAVQVMKGEK